MEFESVKSIVKSRPKGVFTRIAWQRELPLKKEYREQYGVPTVKKVTTAVVRFGVDYGNIKAVQSKRQLAGGGTIAAQQGELAWGAWTDYPYFINHKDKTYLRCTTSKANKPTENYYLEGVGVITAEQAKELCLKSAFSKTDRDVFTLSVDNILSVG